MLGGRGCARPDGLPQACPPPGQRRALSCRRSRFPNGLQLWVRWAQIALDDADLAAPSILTGVPPFPDLDEGRWASAIARVLPTSQWPSQPRLLSLRRADVAGLTVAKVDLRACQFADAHNLDKLRTSRSAPLPSRQAAGAGRPTNDRRGAPLAPAPSHQPPDPRTALRDWFSSHASPGAYLVAAGLPGALPGLMRRGATCPSGDRWPVPGLARPRGQQGRAPVRDFYYGDDGDAPP